MAICTGDSIVQNIERTECIGNSLTKINNNFSALDVAVCEVSNVTSLITNVNGILKSDGTGTITAAVSGVDYYVPGTNLTAGSIAASGAIVSSGNVSGTSITTSGTITSTGDIRSAGDVIAYFSSDERLKKNITDISGALDKVSSIRGVEYEWNTDLQDTYNGSDVGVIAQEIEKVLPAAVIDRDNGYKAVKYERIIPLLIEAIKDLKKEIELLKS